MAAAVFVGLLVATACVPSDGSPQDADVGAATPPTATPSTERREDGSGEAYAGLTDDVRAYIIPGSADLGPGNPCDGADCTGAITRAQFLDGPWLRFERYLPLSGRPGSPESVRIAIEPIDVFGERRTDDPAVVEVWGEQLALIADAWSRDYETWIQLCSAGEILTGCRALALDDQGRVAGVGYGANLMVTGTLARAAMGSPTARSYLVDLLVNGAPPDQLEWGEEPPPPPPEQLVPGLEEDPNRTAGAVLLDVLVRSEVVRANTVLCVRSSVAVGLCAGEQPLRDGTPMQVWMRDDPTVEIVQSTELDATLADAPVIARFTVELPPGAPEGTHVGFTAVELAAPGAFGEGRPFAGTVQVLDGCPEWTLFCEPYLPATLVPS